MSSDNDRKTPVEIAVARHRRWWLAIVVLLLLALVYYLVFVNQYVVAFKSQSEHFMHGSIGSETATGPPYWVFKALAGHVCRQARAGRLGPLRLPLRKAGRRPSDRGVAPRGLRRRAGLAQLFRLPCRHLSSFWRRGSPSHPRRAFQ